MIALQCFYSCERRKDIKKMPKPFIKLDEPNTNQNIVIERKGNKPMKSTNKLLWVFSALIILAMMITSCAPAAPEATQAPAVPEAPAATKAPTVPDAPVATEAPVVVKPAEKKIIRVAYNRELDVLNPFTSQMSCSIEFTMQEGLVQNNDKGEVVPILAKEIPSLANGGIVAKPDGTYEITWHLQEGVKWHDGVDFTSKDVCFTSNWITSEGSETYNRDDYLGIKNCATPDDNTAVFTWDGLYGGFSNLFESILPEHLLGKLSTVEIVQNVEFNRSPIGTGPYKFAEWKAGEYIRVVKNENYWRGPDYPKADEMIFQFITDDNTRLNALKTGEYTIGEILPLQVKEFKDNPNGTVKMIDSNRFMRFDVSITTEKGKKLFSDVNVRQAIYHAIDRQAIADQLLEGTVTVINSPLNPNGVWVNKNVKAYNYDMALAQKMLDEAGWVVGPDGVRAKDGQRFSFTILLRGGAQDRIAIAQVIQAELKEVGIEVQFEVLESTASTAKWRSGDWEATVSAYFLTADPSITTLYLCGGSNNFSGFCDPKLDEALKASDLNIDFEKRKPLLDEAQAILAEDAFTLPLYSQVTPMYISNNLEGFLGSGTNFESYWNVYEWGLK
jgi:peptide/nickel transport system substrate-binding protein